MLFSPRFDHANRPSGRGAPAGGTLPSVLLIGDARPRTTYRTILSQGSYELFDVDGGDEALRLARKLRPSLIMMELTMQLGDGWELNRQLKGDRSTYLIPVVATSLACLPKGTYHRARSAGFVDLVTKPIERRHVLEVVSTWSRPAPQIMV